MTPAEARVVTAMRAAGLELPPYGGPLKDTLNAIADGIEHLHAELGKARARVAELERLRALKLVGRQAEDPGLWFEAQTASEAYLQAELRRLHAAIESAALTAAGFLGEAKADG